MRFDSLSSHRYRPGVVAVLIARRLLVAIVTALAFVAPIHAHTAGSEKVHLHALGPLVLDDTDRICVIAHDEGEPYLGIERLELYSTVGAGPPPPLPAPDGTPLHLVVSLTPGPCSNGAPCGTAEEWSACQAAGGTCPMNNRFGAKDCCTDCLRPGKQFICAVVHQKDHEVSGCAFYQGAKGIGRLTPDEGYPVLVTASPERTAIFCDKSYDEWKTCCPVMNLSTQAEQDRIVYRRPCPPWVLCDPPPQLGTPHLIIGTAFDDTIRDDDGNACIYGLDGADVVRGGAGDDEIHGGPGADVLRGGAGNDRLHGDEDDDKLLGGAGTDTLCGEDGEDDLSGGGGADMLAGGPGQNVCHHTQQADSCAECTGSSSCGQQSSSFCVLTPPPPPGCGDSVPPNCGGECPNAALCTAVTGTCQCVR